MKTHYYSLPSVHASLTLVFAANTALAAYTAYATYTACAAIPDRHGFAIDAADAAVVAISAFSA